MALEVEGARDYIFFYYRYCYDYAYMCIFYSYFRFYSFIVVRVRVCTYMSCMCTCMYVCMYVCHVYMYVYMCTSCIQNLFLLLHVQHVYPFVFLNSLVSALRYSTSSVAATLINTMGTPTIIRIRVARIIVAVTVDVAHTKRLRRAIQKLRKMH